VFGGSGPPARPGEQANTDIGHCALVSKVDPTSLKIIAYHYQAWISSLHR
jgi:hypothetical protein